MIEIAFFLLKIYTQRNQTILLLQEIGGLLRRLFKTEQNWGVLWRHDNPALRKILILPKISNKSDVFPV